MSEPKLEPPVLVIGIDDGGPAGLSPAARMAVEQAEVLVGGRRHLALFPDQSAEKLVIAGGLEPVLTALERQVGRRCVVLASGDPCFYGIGPLLAERLGRERVRIWPAPSAVALAFARLGLAWQDATVLSAHGRPLAGLIEPARRAARLAILTDEENTPSAVASALLEAGLPDCPAYVCERLGGDRERIVASRLAELPGQQFDPLNVLVLLPGERPVEVLFGQPESEFACLRGQITKAEARAVALAKLRLPLAGVLWDLGAGAGSLAIEAAGLMPGGRVFAVEREPEQVEVLRQNLQRHRCPGVEVVAGEAPAALAGLPRPDRVFLGGGGEAIGALARTCLVALAGRGRLVANAATLDSALALERAVEEAGWESELVQLAVARGRRIGGRTGLAALNPVFVLSAWPAAVGAEG